MPDNSISNRRMQASNRPTVTSAKDSIEEGFRSGFNIPNRGIRHPSTILDTQARYWESFFSSPDTEERTLRQTSSNLESSNGNPKTQSRTVHVRQGRELRVCTRDHEAPATIGGGPYVTYCYRSSLSTSRLPHGFGAIGDGRPPSSFLVPVINDSTVDPENSLSLLSGEGGIKKSPISELIPDTTPEQKPYSLISLNRRPENRLADLPLITPSDLFPQPIHPQSSGSSLRPVSYSQTMMLYGIDSHNRENEAKTLGVIPKSNELPSVWKRKGKPFSFTLRSPTSDAILANRVHSKDNLDPNPFFMPAGVCHALTNFGLLSCS